MIQQLFSGKVGGKNPVFECIGVKAVAVSPCEFPEPAFGQYNFCGFETLQELVCSGCISFCNEELAGGDIEKCQSEALVFAIGERGEIIIVVVFEERVVGGYTRCYYFGDRSFDHLSRHRFFHLLADSHAVACAHEAGEVSFERVEWETGQFYIGTAIIAAGKGDTEGFT